MLTVPVGVDEFEFDWAATVMVIAWVAPDMRFVPDGDKEVVLASSAAAELEGHAVSRLLKSIDPSPVALSYPVPAEYSDDPSEEQ